MTYTDTEIKSRILAKVQKHGNGCWLWTAAMTGGPSPDANLGLWTDGHQHNLTVRRWLWRAHYGYEPPLPLVHCPHSQRCVRPQHNPLRYAPETLMAIRHAFRAGTPCGPLHHQYGVHVQTLHRLLTPEDWEAHRQAREVHHAAAFWQHVIHDGEHWRWTRRSRSVAHEGHTIQAKQKAWLLSGRDLPPEVILWTACEEPSCIRPEHQRAHTAPAARVAKHKRGARVAARNARIVELSVRYGWTQKAIATLFEISVALVVHVLRQGGISGQTRSTPRPSTHLPREVPRLTPPRDRGRVDPRR